MFSIFVKAKGSGDLYEFSKQEDAEEYIRDLCNKGGGITVIFGMKVSFEFTRVRLDLPDLEQER